MKRIFALLLAATMLLGMLGMTAAADDDRVLKAAYAGIASTMDPADVMTLNNAICCSNYYEGLLRRDTNYVLTPSIAESWDISDDNLTYTFHINQNATFTTGEKITAADVEASFHHFVEGAQNYVFKIIDTMNVIDDSTISVTLKSPMANFLSYLANPLYFSVLSAKALEEYGDEYGLDMDHIVGSGAYDITGWDFNVKMTFTAREDFFLGTPAIKNAEVYSITDSNGAMVALQSGDIDVYYVPVSGSNYATMQMASNIAMSEYESTKFENIHFLCETGIFSDVRMRQAVSMAVIAEEALLVGADGLGTVTRFPGDISAITAAPDYDSPYAYQYDLEAARALVEECGMKGAEVVIKAYTTEPYPTLSTWLQGVLTNIGLNASVEIMERGAWITACAAKEIEILILSWNGGTYDMDESLGNLLNSACASGAGNYGWYNNETVDALLKEARELTDEAAREEIYKQVIDIMYQDAAIVPLYGNSNAIAHSADLNLTESGRGYAFFDYSWNE